MSAPTPAATLRALGHRVVQRSIRLQAMLGDARLQVPLVEVRWERSPGLAEDLNVEMKAGPWLF